MSIKNLLEKSMLRLGSRGGMPPRSGGPAGIGVTMKANADISYTAPRDGYLQVWATPSRDTAYILFYGQGTISSISRTAGQNYGMYSSYMMRQGSTVVISSSGVSEATAAFYASVGGGD